MTEDHSHTGRPASPDLRLMALLAAAGMLWLWLGFSIHTVEIAGGELDQYLIRARAILAGSDNKDPYHPAGYPLWIAGTTFVTGDPFTAARLLGVAFGLLLVWASHGIARLFLAPWPSLMVAALVGMSDFVLVGAVQACSDVPAASMATLATLQWCRRARTGTTTRRLLLGGLALGVATSFRWASLWLGIGFLPLLLARGTGARGTGARAWMLACTIAAFVVGLAPHLYWYGRVFGDPNHNLAWHNFVLKFHCNFDEACWVDNTARYADIVATEWKSWVWPAVLDALTHLASGLSAGIGFGSNPALAIAVSIACLAGFVRFLRSKDPALVLLAVSCLLYSALMAATFRAIDRFTIPQVLPTILALSVPLAMSGRKRASTLALLVLSAAAAWRLPATVSHFVDRHPHEENRAVAAMQADIGAPVRALVRPFFACSGSDPWRELRRLLDAHDNEFLVLSRSTSEPAIRKLLATTPPPGFAVLRNDELLVVDASVTESPWLASAEAVPRDGRLQMRMELQATGAEDPILMAALIVGTKRNGSFAWQHVPLAPAGERVFVGSLPLETLRGVTCRFVPAVIQASGIIRRATPFELTP